ncbi:MAG: thioredoxin family protein [Candidatus Omnitrophota bacterium]|nr:thioredoxin family protein [Candidatus Omnitrophota bacterium]MDZ4242795.1 thioredoxin family protein [Candidatus Omnitrophota bacterium]
MSLASPALAMAGGITIAHTRVGLVAEDVSVQPGRSFFVGLRMRMDRGWHVYWENPGDSGMAPAVRWQLPEGFDAGPLLWPYPHRIEQPPLASFGYEGEVLLLTEIRPGPHLSSDRVTLGAHVEWLSCRVECIPGQADLTLDLPVAALPPQPDLRWTSIFALARQSLPVSEGSVWDIKVFEEAPGFLMDIVPSGPAVYPLTGIQFFPERNDLIRHAVRPQAEMNGEAYRLRLEKSPLLSKVPERLTGVLVSDQGWQGEGTSRALQVDAVVRQPFSGQRVVGGLFSGPVAAAMIFAFLGGLILNLMPCVLPVLSLKVFHLIQQSSRRRTSSWRQGGLFTAGVLASFWILAGILMFLRWSGEQVGWGFQFQSPGFLVGLSFLFFLIGMNFFGVFELSSPGLAVPSGRTGEWGAFASGFLTAVVATPCTAPFMGAAIGVALTQPWPITLVIFSFLGLGLAFPYLVCAGSPALLKVFPKPGVWMEHMKTVFGFFMMATVVWLAWILSLQAGKPAVVSLLFGLLLAASGSRLWGLGSVASLVRTQQRLCWGGVFFVLAGIGIAAAGLPDPGTFSQKSRLVQAEGPWQDFSMEKLEELRREGRPVFVDFTASWCLTCQVNERVALQDPRVLAKFQEMGVALLKADWTRRDEEITRALERYGKNSIPLYVLYPSFEGAPPRILPEILTPGIVLEFLEKAEKNH